MISSLALMCPALGGETSADLDGDGKDERVTWTLKSGDVLGEMAEVRIQAGGEKWLHAGDWLEVDVTKTSPWGKAGRDILVVGIGHENDFWDYVLVGRPDKTGKLGELERGSAWGHVRFPGNGSCVTNNWEGFWKRVDKYKVSPTGKLVLMPQPFHHVGIKATTKASFPIYQERDGKDVLATIGAGSSITLVLCKPVADPKGEDVLDPMLNDWYLIKSVTGFLGWVRFGDVRQHLELPWAG